MLPEKNMCDDDDEGKLSAGQWMIVLMCCFLGVIPGIIVGAMFENWNRNEKRAAVETGVTKLAAPVVQAMAV